MATAPLTTSKPPQSDRRSRTSSVRDLGGKGQPAGKGHYGFTHAVPTAPKARTDAKPEINVTPLVDVVLVLLIIFMVIAPALEHGERVELPGVAHTDKSEKGKMDPITITLGGSGSVFWEKEVVTEDSLPARLADVHVKDPSRRVVIKGDGTIPYERARSMFAMVQGQGITGCSLMVQKRKGAKDEEE
ncbi:MAG: biopolymer transporter ExbD [Polyangiaceae bacterium]|nr:biopolymer transporter ExbD [Polyangiaceae bacterium]